MPVGETHSPGEARGPMAPRLLHDNLLDQEAVGALLAWVLASQDRFAPSLVRGGYRPANRSCLSFPLEKSEPWHERLSQAVLSLLPEVLHRFSLKPFQLLDTELEVSAYNDGAFFRPHIDTATGVEERRSYRIVSGVYYSTCSPKASPAGSSGFIASAVVGTMGRTITRSFP